MRRRSIEIPPPLKRPDCNRRCRLYSPRIRSCRTDDLAVFLRSSVAPRQKFRWRRSPRSCRGSPLSTLGSSTESPAGAPRPRETHRLSRISFTGRSAFEAARVHLRPKGQLISCGSLANSRSSALNWPSSSIPVWLRVYTTSENTYSLSRI